MTNTIINFNDHSFEDLKTLKADLTSYLKDKRVELFENAKKEREARKAELSEAAKSFVVKGADVTVNYKGEEITGTVIGLKEKTFTIEVDVDGELKKVWRYFHQVVMD